MRKGWLFWGTGALCALGCGGQEAPGPPDAVTPPPPPSAELVPEATAVVASPSGPRFPYLKGERQGASVSIGDTSHGLVLGSRALEEGPALGILPEQKKRDLGYGTEELVGLLQYAAAELHRETKTRMWVGNLGRLEGGDISYSVSHNAGRDADVAFCYLDAQGRAVDPPDLVPLGKSGTSKDGRLSFDAARSWVLVRSLLLYPGASVQYIFVSEPLRKLLLDYGRKKGEAATVMLRASAVLRQPAGAAPHDDHFHVRVYCGARDVAGGCVDSGPVHSFAHIRSAERPRAAKKAREQAASPEAETRAGALLRLGLVGDNSDAALGVARLDDPSPEVRAAACALIGAVGDQRQVPALSAFFARESDSRVLPAVIDAIAALGGEAAGVFLRDLLLAAEATPWASPPSGSGFPVPESLGQPASPLRLLEPLLAPREALVDRAALRALAVRGSGRADRLETLAPLMQLLATSDDVLQASAIDSLAQLTNHRPKASSPPDAPGRDPAASDYYLQLARRMGSLPRERWLISGFVARGFEVKALDRQNAWELLRAVQDLPHISQNARRTLSTLLGESPESMHWHAGEACRQHLRSLQSRRQELSLPRPTQAQLSACVGRSQD